MALTPASITGAILAAAPELAGPNGATLATVVGSAVYTWAIGGPANLALVGVSHGSVGAGVVTSLPGNLYFPTSIPVVLSALQAAGVTGSNSSLVAKGIGIGVATIFTAIAQYTGPSVGVAVGTDFSSVVVANPATLIPLIASGFGGPAGPAVSVGIGNGIASLLLLGGSSSPAPVTGTPGGPPSVGISGPSTIF